MVGGGQGGSGVGGSVPQVTPLEYDGSGYSFSFRIQVENPQVRVNLKIAKSPEPAAVQAMKSCLLGGEKTQ